MKKLAYLKATLEISGTLLGEAHAEIHKEFPNSALSASLHSLVHLIEVTHHLTKKKLRKIKTTPALSAGDSSTPNATKPT